MITVQWFGVWYVASLSDSTSSMLFVATVENLQEAQLLSIVLFL